MTNRRRTILSAAIVLCMACCLSACNPKEKIDELLTPTSVAEAIAAKKADDEYKAAVEAWQDATILAAKFPDNATYAANVVTTKTEMDNKKTAKATADSALSTAKSNYETAKKNDDDAKAPVDAAKKAYDTAQKAADDLEAWVLDPKYQTAVDDAQAKVGTAQIDADDAKTALETAEAALADAFEALDQKGVKYEEDTKFVELYEAYQKAENTEWTNFNTAQAALIKLYNEVYVNKDGNDYRFNYLKASYDVDPKFTYISGGITYNWKTSEYELDVIPYEGYQAYNAEYDYYYSTWNENDAQRDDEMNLVIWERYSASYYKDYYGKLAEKQADHLAVELNNIAKDYEDAFYAIDKIKAKLDTYDSYKEAYVEMLSGYSDLVEAYIEAAKAYFEASWAYTDAKAAYMALRDATYNEVVVYQYDDDTEDYYAVTISDINELIDYYESKIVYWQAWAEYDLQAIEDYYEEATIDLDKEYLELELLYKKVVILQALADEYQAILEELLGVDLNVFDAAE